MIRGISIYRDRYLVGQVVDGETSFGVVITSDDPQAEGQEFNGTDIVDVFQTARADLNTRLDAWEQELIQAVAGE